MPLSNTDPYAGDPDSFPANITIATDATEKTAESVAVPLAELADRTACLVPKITVITATAVWDKDPLAVFIQFKVIGKGGDGAASVGGTATSGGGGGSGAILEAEFPADLVPDTLYAKINVSGRSAIKDVNDTDFDNVNSFLLQANNGANASGATGGDGGSSDHDAVQWDGGGTVTHPSIPGTKGGDGGTGGGTGGAGGTGYGAVSQADDEAAEDTGGVGGRGYGAGGGGGGTTTGAAAGGGQGANGYGYTKFATDGATGSGNQAGGVGAPGAVIIVEWKGLPL